MDITAEDQMITSLMPLEYGSRDETYSSELTEEIIPNEREVVTQSVFYKQLLVTISVCTSIFSTGIALVWASANIEGAKVDLKLDEINKSHIPVAIVCGYIVGSICFGIFGNLIGRKLSFIIGDLFSLVGYILLIVTFKLELVYTGLFLLGLGSAILEFNVYVYVAEISYFRYRGYFCTLCVFMLYLGKFYNAVLGSFQLHWHTETIFCVIPCLINLIVCIFIPESYTWLTINNKVEKAHKSIEWFYNTKSKEFSDRLLDSITIRNFESADKFKLKNLTERVHMLPLFHVVVIETLRKLMLIETIETYSTFIFGYITRVKSLYMPMLFHLSELLGFCFSIGLANRIGRRTLLISSGLGLCLVSTLTSLNLQYNVDFGDWINVLLLILLGLFFTLGWGGTTKVLYAELTSHNVRNIAFASQGAIGKGVLFVLILKYFEINESLHVYGSYSLIAVISCVASIYIFVFIPETRNKSYQSIQDEFDENIMFCRHAQR